MIAVPPAGHRAHQLRYASELLDRYADGLVLDVGAGTGWIGRGAPQRVVSLDVVAPTGAISSPWVLGTADRLPLRDEAFDAVAALAALGALSRDALDHAVSELVRVTRVGAHVVVLVSVRRTVIDLVAPHRVRSGWKWSSFTPSDLTRRFEAAGCRRVWSERRGGMRTLLAEWAWTLLAPIARGPRSRRVVERMAEFDGPDFTGPRSSNGRYLYLVLERVS